MKLLVPALLAVMVWFAVPRAMGAGPYEDLPLGALSAEAVKGVMQTTLSPQGKFVILAANGTVRVYDTPDKIAAVRGALQALENAPAIVSFAVVVKTGMHKVTKSTSTALDGSDYGIPIPNTYAPPQIISTGRGYVVVPATPTSFTTRPVGVVSGGYAGTTVSGPMVNTQETSIEGGVLHRYAGSTVFPKPVAVTVCAKVPDAGALHDWAVKNGAVPENEPAWTAARSEILVTPEHAENGIMLNLQPQVVVAAADGSPRVIPLKTCAASVAVKPGAVASFDGFPGADADFYGAFLGATESTGDAISSVSVGARVDYVAPPAPGAQTAQPAPATPVAQPAPATPVAQPAPATPVAQPAPATPVAQPAPATPVAQPAPPAAAQK